MRTRPTPRRRQSRPRTDKQRADLMRREQIERETDADTLHFVTATVDDWQLERALLTARVDELDADILRLIEKWAR